MKREREQCLEASFSTAKKVKPNDTLPLMLGNEDTVQFVLVPLLDLPTLHSLGRTSRALRKCCLPRLQSQPEARRKTHVLFEAIQQEYLELFLLYAEEDAFDNNMYTPRWYMGTSLSDCERALCSLWKTALQQNKIALLRRLRHAMGVGRTLRVKELYQPASMTAIINSIGSLFVQHCHTLDTVLALYTEANQGFEFGINGINSMTNQLIASDMTNRALATFLTVYVASITGPKLCTAILNTFSLSPVGKVCIDNIELLLVPPSPNTILPALIIKDKFSAASYYHYMLVQLLSRHALSPWASKAYHAILPYVRIILPQPRIKESPLPWPLEAHMLVYKKLPALGRPLYSIPWLKYHHTLPPVQILDMLKTTVSKSESCATDLFAGLLRITLPWHLAVVLDYIVRNFYHQGVEKEKEFFSVLHRVAIATPDITEETWEVLHRHAPCAKYEIVLRNMCPTTAYNFFKTVPLDRINMKNPSTFPAHCGSTIAATREEVWKTFQFHNTLDAEALEEIQIKAEYLLPLILQHMPDFFHAPLNLVIFAVTDVVYNGTYCLSFSLLLTGRIIDENICFPDKDTNDDPRQCTLTSYWEPQ